MTAPVMETVQPLMLLPAPAGTCPTCAHRHPADQPHNAQTLFFQVKFQMENRRSPTWADAWAHCADPVKAAWRQGLMDLGVDVDGGQISPPKAAGDA